MDKRYQVFVSSTFEDLKVERQYVIQALLELNCIPAGMELFPAADDDQWTLIKSVIDDCDYYIVIVGGRYGSLGPDGIGYTEMEYRYALETGKPVIGFVHGDPGSILVGKTDGDPAKKAKLEEFISLVRQKMCKSWKTPDELGSVVSRSLVNLMRTRPAIGWVKGDQVPDEAASTELLRLRKRIDELEAELKAAAERPPEGTANLAQEDDEFEIGFTYTVYLAGEVESSTFQSNYKTTWNEIFAALAPAMMGELSDTFFENELTDFIKREGLKAELAGLEPGYYSAHLVGVANQDFQTIKVQLRALGLIEPSTRTQEAGTYWTLTRYGSSMMDKLRAIRKW